MWSDLRNGMLKTIDSHSLLNGGGNGQGDLHSTRTYAGVQNMVPAHLISGRNYNDVNLESTQELKDFVTIDLGKINKVRQNQLKLALEDNLREKEEQVQQVQKAYEQQKSEFNQISQQLESNSTKLDEEVTRMRSHMNSLKKKATKLNSEQIQLNDQLNILKETSEITIESFEKDIQIKRENLRIQESELQILRFEKQSLEQRIEVRKRVKKQEFDNKVNPLVEERDKIQLSLDLSVQNLLLLQAVLKQNENEKQMIEEDIGTSQSIKMELIYQREDIEQYVDKTQQENPDIKFLINYSSSHHENQSSTALKALIFEKQQSLLLDLVRELQQYILGLSSNTTDNSVLQSDELEELQQLIEKNTVNSEDAVDMIVSFAQAKMKLDINKEVLHSKLEEICNQIDQEAINEQLNEIQSLDSQMKDIDFRIKVITNRCQNELIPRLKALTSSEKQMNEETTKLEKNIETLSESMNQFENLIEEISIAFEQTIQNQSNEEQFEDMQEKINNLTSVIEQNASIIDSLQEELSNLEQRKEDFVVESQESVEQMTLLINQVSSEHKIVLDEILHEKSNALQYEFTNPLVQQLTKTVSQLKSDKESAYKRLKYIEVKLQNAQESVMHAKSVLDSHTLQIQQELLHKNVNQSVSLKPKQYSNAAKSQYLQVNEMKPESIKTIPQMKCKETLTGSCSPKSKQNASISLKTDLIPNRSIQHSHQYSQSAMGFTRDLKNQHCSAINIEKLDLIDPEETRSVFIESENIHKKGFSQCNLTKSIKNCGASLEGTSQNQKVLSQKHREIIEAYLKKDKSISAADLVKYKYESSCMQTSQQDSNSYRNSIGASQYNPTTNNEMQQNKLIPIQALITPRETNNDMQYNHSHQASITSEQTMYELGYCGNFAHNSSISSSDSTKFEHFIRKEDNNFANYKRNAQINDQHSMNTLQQSSKYVPSVKISLRQSHNSSLDAHSMSNSIASSINFKENVAPNTISAATGNLNMRKLSQAASLSQLQTLNTANVKPPAVPSSKQIVPQAIDQNHFYILSETLNNNGHIESTKKRNFAYQGVSSTHRTKNNSTLFQEQSNNGQGSQFNSNRLSQQCVQTKMRLCQNSNNGKILAVGIVELARCNQNHLQKDTQFFESIKPLIEGSQFLCMSKMGQCQSKHIFLDFSLLRLFLTNSTGSINGEGRRDVIMVEAIAKTELPQSTLDLIKSEKSANSATAKEKNHDSKRYEFHLILNKGGVAERVQFMAHSFEELRAWIVGLNALISNKNNLMRLSSLIKS